MSDIESMQAELSELDEQAAELSKRRKDLRQRIADAQAVFKVGDRITHDKANCVWEITAIAPGYYDKPDYIGAKLKKDGTPGKVVGRIWEPHKTPLRLA